MRFAREHYTESAFKARDAADAAGVTPQRLSQLFHTHTGATFTDWLARYRVSKAMSLLREGRRKVIDIAGDCGFGAVSSFNRVFRHVAGISPRQYRQGAEPEERILQILSDNFLP